MRGLATATGLAAAGAQWLPAVAPVVRPLRQALGVRDRVRGAGVGLTFDDGPHPLGTPAVLEGLADAGAPATFFLVGEQVERYPSLAREVTGAGHELGVHCHRHRNNMRLTPRQALADLERALAAIEDATGRSPRLHRPPYGIYTSSVLALVRRRGLEPLLWSQWGRDWRRSATAASITRKLTASLASGDVLLLHDADHYSSHDSWRATVAALPMVLEEIARRGLTAAAVS